MIIIAAVAATCTMLSPGLYSWSSFNLPLCEVSGAGLSPSSFWVLSVLLHLVLKRLTFMNYPTQVPHCVQSEEGTGWGFQGGILRDWFYHPMFPHLCWEVVWAVAAFLGSQNSLTVMPTPISGIHKHVLRILRDSLFPSHRQEAEAWEVKFLAQELENCRSGSILLTVSPCCWVVHVCYPPRMRVTLGS